MLRWSVSRECFDFSRLALRLIDVWSGESTECGSFPPRMRGRAAGRLALWALFQWQQTTALGTRHARRALGEGAK